MPAIIDSAPRRCRSGVRAMRRGWVAFSNGDVDAELDHLERYYEHLERSDRVFDQVFGAYPLAVTLAMAGRDAGVLARYSPPGWPRSRWPLASAGTDWSKRVAR